MSSRTQVKPDAPVKPTDLLIRQKCEAMILYGYVALRQFPAFERHVLAAEMRLSKLRRSSIQRIKSTLREMRTLYADGRISLQRVGQSVRSWVEHAKHANTWLLRNHTLQSFSFVPSDRQQEPAA